MSVGLSLRPTVRLSVCMEQLVSCWMDYNEVRYLGILRKSVEKMQVSSKSDNNNCTLP